MFSRRLVMLLGFPLALGAGAAGPFVPADIYGTDGPAFFRSRRVREVEIVEQTYAPGGAPGPRRAVSVQQLDARGRLVYELSAPEQGRFTFRQEYAYNPAGQQTDVTSFRRLADPADTTRRGRVWLPHQHRLPAPSPAGQGFTDTWNARTGDRQRTETTRRWTRHDTAYQVSQEASSPEHRRLTRSYTGPDSVWRYDVVELQRGRPWHCQYHYVRRERGRQVEVGRLRFEEALGDLMARQQLPMLAGESATYRRALDNLTRHSRYLKGRLLVQGTHTYDAQGRLLTRTTPSARLTFERNAQGQVSRTKQVPASGSASAVAERTTYVYQPDGLVARQETADSLGQLTSILYYRYRYYAAALK